MGDMVRVRKNVFRQGYWSVHKSKFRKGKLVSDSVVDYFKRKKDADDLANSLRRKKRG